MIVTLGDSREKLETVERSSLITEYWGTSVTLRRFQCGICRTITSSWKPLEGEVLTRGDDLEAATRNSGFTHFWLASWPDLWDKLPSDHSQFQLILRSDSGVREETTQPCRHHIYWLSSESLSWVSLAFLILPRPEVVRCFAGQMAAVSERLMKLVYRFLAWLLPLFYFLTCDPRSTFFHFLSVCQRRIFDKVGDSLTHALYFWP